MNVSAEKGETKVKENWIAKYNGPVSYHDEATAITTDKFGNIYVTGASNGHQTYYDYVTISYDNNGNLRWLQRYDGQVSYHDKATAITTDNFGNIYVTGASYGHKSFYDYVHAIYIDIQSLLAQDFSKISNLQVSKK